jgi:UDP-3-O-[3-hydroxymyristoyl] glucosamine N-acyltransferase
MLVNYTINDTLYIVGRGINSTELHDRLQQEQTGKVELILAEQFFNLPDNSQCIIGIWDVDYRKTFIKDAKHKPTRWVSYIHDKSFVSDITGIGKGVVVYPFAYIGYGVKIDDFSMIGQHTNIGHGSQVGKNNVICPGVVFGGTVTSGNNVLFGINCAVRDNLSITDDVTFFMGSLVSKHIELPGIYYGNRRFRNNECSA